MKKIILFLLPLQIAMAAPFTCKDMQKKDAMKMFEKEVKIHKKNLETKKNSLESWKNFDSWLTSLLPCAGPQMTPVLMQGFESGMIKNFPGFLEFYRLEKTDKTSLKQIVNSIYHATKDSDISPKSTKALKIILEKDCPEEFTDICTIDCTDKEVLSRNKKLCSKIYDSLKFKNGETVTINCTKDFEDAYQINQCQNVLKKTQKEIEDKVKKGGK